MKITYLCLDSIGMPDNTVILGTLGLLLMVNGFMHIAWFSRAQQKSKLTIVMVTA